MDKSIRFISIIVGIFAISISGLCVPKLLEMGFMYGILWFVLWVLVVLITSLLGVCLIAESVNPDIKQF